MIEDKKEQRKGEALIFFESIIWALFPVITILSYNKLPSLISLGYSTIFSAVLFCSIVTFRKKWHELYNPLLWKYCLVVVIFLGVLFYSFFYIGLVKTSAGNAGIIALFEVFTSFLFFHVFRKDIISLEYKIGAVLMIIGALIVLGNSWNGVNWGDLLVLVATFFAPIGNHFQQKARKIASTESIMFLRNALSFPIIFILAYVLGQHASWHSVQGSMLFLFINGFIVLGFSKLLWVEAIHRISVTKAVALESIAPLLTLFFAWIMLKQNPNLWQFVSLVPMFIGVLFLTDNVTFKKLLK